MHPLTTPINLSAWHGSLPASRPFRRQYLPQALALEMLCLVVAAAEGPAARVREAVEGPAARVQEAAEGPAARVREAAVVLEAELLPPAGAAVPGVVALELAEAEALAEGLLPRAVWQPREPQVVAEEQAAVPELQAVAARQAEPQQLEPAAELAGWRGRHQALVLRPWASCPPVSSPWPVLPPLLSYLRVALPWTRP